MPAGLTPVTLFTWDMFPQHPTGLVRRGCLSPNTKGCLPSWQKRRAESWGGAVQRVCIKAGHNQTAGAGRGQGAWPGRPWSPAAHPAHPTASPGHRCWQPPPLPAKGLCSVKRWMGHGSEEAKSPKIALIQKVSIIQRERGELLLTEDAKSTNCLLVKKGFVSIEHDR